MKMCSTMVMTKLWRGTWDINPGAEIFFSTICGRQGCTQNIGLKQVFWSIPVRYNKMRKDADMGVESPPKKLLYHYRKVYNGS